MISERDAHGDGGAAGVELLRNEFNFEVPALLVGLSAESAGSSGDARSDYRYFIGRPMLAVCAPWSAICYTRCRRRASPGTAGELVDRLPAHQDCQVVIIPTRRATSTACVRLTTPNTLKIAVTCALTVFSDNPSSVAICLVRLALADA